MADQVYTVKHHSHGRQKTAQSRITDDHDGADNHCRNIGNSKQIGKKFAAGCKAGRGIGNKEYDNNQSRYAEQRMAFITKTVGEEVRNRNGVSGSSGITAQPFGNDQPVKISAYGKSDRSPAGVGNTG